MSAFLLWNKPCPTFLSPEMSGGEGELHQRDDFKIWVHGPATPEASQSILLMYPVNLIGFVR